MTDMTRDTESEGVRLGFFQYLGLARQCQAFSGRVEAQSPCVDWLRDSARVLILPIFAAQMVHYQLAIGDAAGGRRLSALWYSTAALALLVFLAMLLCWRQYCYVSSWLMELLWNGGLMRIITPLGGFYSLTWYRITDGHACIPYYGGWAFYVLVALVPRYSYLVLGTTAAGGGALLPASLMVCTFLLNLCLNIGYLLGVEKRGEANAVHAMFSLIGSISKSVVDLLDAEAILNEVGSVQGSFDRVPFLALSLAVLLSVTVHVAAITLYVHFKTSALWTHGSLTRMVEDEDKTTRDYGRTNVLFFVLFLLSQMLADLVILAMRLLIAARHAGRLSSFVYKNLFYIPLHFLHIYSLMLILVTRRETAQ